MALVKKCRHGKKVPPAKREAAWRRCDCTWYADIRVDGSRRYIRVGSDLRAAKAEHRRLVEKGQPTPVDGGNGFAALSERWIAANGGKRPATIKGYRNAVSHATRYLGSTDVRRVTAALLQEMEGDLILSGMAPLNARRVRTVAVMVLRHAESDGILESVPRGKFPKARPRKKITVFTPAQLANLWATALPALDGQGRPIRRGADYPKLFQFLAVGGFRIGEALALVADDLDVAANAVLVTKTWTPKGISPHPKTDASNRTVFLPPGAITDLVDVNAEGRLWPVGYPAALTTWHRLLEVAGMPKVGLHTLRHSNASMRIRTGQDIVFIADQLGHAEPDVTLNTYGHLIPGDRPDVSALNVMIHGGS